MRVFESTRIAAAFLFCLALLGRAVLVIGNQFDGLYGQDAYAYYGYARELFHAVTHFQLPPPFWWPLGYPALLSIAFLLGGVNIASAQIVTMVCGALIAPLAYLLAHEAASYEYKNVAAWVAGLICAVGGQLAQSSVVIMADAPALMFATLGAWLLLRYARTRNVSTLALASFAVGMAVWTRWQNLIFAAVWVVALGGIELAKESGKKREGMLRFVGALAMIGIVLLPQVLIRSISNAPLAGQSWLEGWSVGNFLARSFENVDGHFEYALPVAVFYGQVFLHPAYLFVILTPMFGVGVFVLGERLRRWTAHRTSLRAGSILLLGWIVGMYIFLAGIPYENFRFPLGLFAPIAVVTGIGAGWLWDRWRASRLRFVWLGWIAVALLVMLLWQPRVLAPVLEIKAREIAHTRWLETRLLPNALLYAMSIDGAVQTYSQIRVENLWNLDPATLKRDIPTYLYVDTQNIGQQWRGRLPDQLVRGLSETNYLHPLERFEGWTLFRVRDCKYRVLDCE